MARSPQKPEKSLAPLKNDRKTGRRELLISRENYSTLEAHQALKDNTFPKAFSSQTIFNTPLLVNSRQHDFMRLPLKIIRIADELFARWGFVS